MNKITIDEALNNEYGLHVGYIGGGTIQIVGNVDGETKVTTSNDTISYDRYKELYNEGCGTEEEYEEFVQLYQYFMDCLR